MGSADFTLAHDTTRYSLREITMLTSQRLLAVSTLIACSGSLAQTPQEPAGNEIEEVMVTAQKRSERLQDVPISIAVLGGAELDQSTSPGIMEALTRVPGVGMLEGF